MNDKGITSGYDGRTKSVKDKGSDEIDMDDKRTWITDQETIIGKSHISNIWFPPQIDGHKNIEGDQRCRTVGEEI